MAKEVDLHRERRKEIVTNTFIDAGPRMAKAAMQFIEENFNSDDKDLRRDAHKLYLKWHDSFIPKTQIVHNKTEIKSSIKDHRLTEFINSVTKNAYSEVKEAESEIIDVEDALSVRRTGK